MDLSHRVLFLVSCLVFIAICFRYKRIGFYVVGAISILFPFLVDTTGYNWFNYAKEYTLLALGFSYMGISSGYFKFLHGYLSIYATSMVVINVLEAVFADLFTGDGYFLNAATGFLVCMTIDFRRNSWFLNKDGFLSMKTSANNIMWILVYFFGTLISCTSLL